nr:MAG TPA: nitrous oxide reductase family maturation protein NosD [Bacteriophage sp.]
MATKEYIGARYVPLFADPIDWDKTKTYEPLTIVSHAGNSYTSRQYVPKDIEITNESYWALTGNYNAQVEQYRKETATVKAGLEAETKTRENADTALSDRITPLEKTMPSKLSIVAHDDTLEGAGVNSNPLKVKLNHSKLINGTDNTVYPALAKNKTTNAIKGLAFNAGDGLTAYDSDNPDVGPGIRLNADIQANIENSENRVFDIKAYKASNDPDYTNAWNRIIAKITDGGTIYFPSGTYNGDFNITKPHITVTGSGIVCNTIHVNVDSTNTNPDMTIINGLTIKSGDAPCINLHHTIGCVITNCNLMGDNSNILAGDVPTHHQYVRQFNISSNHFSGKYGILFKVNGLNPSKYYLGADGIISENEMVNTISNIVIYDSDGININDNVLFLSTGGEDKMYNIYLSNVSYSEIKGNELFEAGSSAIYIGDNNGAIISNNNIVWPGQYHEEAAIKFVGGNTQTGSVKQPCNNLVIGNRFEFCSAYAIWNETKTHNTYMNNYMYEVGSKVHFRGTHTGVKYPAIHDTQTCVCIGNSSRADKVSSSYDILNTNNALSFNDAGLFITEKSWIWKPVEQTIDKNTTSITRHKQGDILIIADTDGTFQKTVTEFLNLGKPSVTPYIGYIISFNSSNKIGDVNLTANKIIPYAIIASGLKFFA